MAECFDWLVFALKAWHAHSCQSQFGQRGGALRGINREQKDAVQRQFESNGWPWNAEVTDVCVKLKTQRCISTSLDKPRPFLFKAFES